MATNFLLRIILVTFLLKLTAGQNLNISSHETSKAYADEISKKIKLLCWILTAPQFHKTRDIHIKKTWGKRCDVLLFMSTVEDKEIPTIALPSRKGTTHLWGKVRESFKYIYRHKYEDADWFLKVDDDTYVIVENLKYMLFPYSPSELLYFGNGMKSVKAIENNANAQEDFESIYTNGGSGYVLSKEAMKRFVEISFYNNDVCGQSSDNANEDLMDRCMEELDIPVVKTQDELKRKRFLGTHSADMSIQSDVNLWFWSARVYNTSDIDNYSSAPVSFYSIKPAQMYFMDFMLYHVRPFGITDVINNITNATAGTKSFEK